MLDRATFLRPIAHRGLHDLSAGRVENTASAFRAAIDKGFGIECDLRPARGGFPVVFHDATLERLIEAKDAVADLNVEDLKRLRHRTGGEAILTFPEFLDLAAGRVPLLVEIKSEWDPPDIAFLSEIARRVLDYRGPLALMSFDPDVMVVMRELATEIPRGIISGGYKDEHGETWWRERIDETRADRLRNLLESGPAAPSLYAYHVTSLPTPVTQYVRAVHGLPVFAWTVRTPEDAAVAKAHADAAVFEGGATGL